MSLNSRQNILLNYRPGDRAGVTFTRISSGTYYNALGQVAVAGNNELRIQFEDQNGDGIRESPGFLIENSRIQRMQSNNTFSGAANGWFYVGAPTILSGYVNVGAFDLTKISVGSGSNYVGLNYSTYTNKPWAPGDGGGIKPFSIFWTRSDVEAAGGASVNITDTTEAAFNRFNFSIQANADGSPKVTMGSGTYLGAEQLLQTGGRAVYRLHFQTGVINAANEHVVRILPGAFGDVIVGGLQIEDTGVFPTSLIWPLTTVTASAFSRDIDTLSLPINFTPQDITVLAEINRPLYAGIADEGLSPGIMAVSHVTPGVTSHFNQSAGTPITAQIRDAVGGIQSVFANSLPSSPRLVIVNQYGNLTTNPQTRIDVGAGFSAYGTPAVTGFKAWGEQQVYLGQRIGNTHRLNAVIFQLLIVAGLLSWQEMQLLADRPYISWIDSLGRAQLNLTLPRFSSWTPDLEQAADSATVVGTGARYQTVYRNDYLATMVARNLKATDLPLAMRLKQWLRSGGTAFIITNDAQSSAYEVRLGPDQDVKIGFADAQTQEYDLELAAKNVADAPLTVQY